MFELSGTDPDNPDWTNIMAANTQGTTIKFDCQWDMATPHVLYNSQQVEWFYNF